MKAQTISASPSFSLLRQRWANPSHKGSSQERFIPKKCYCWACCQPLNFWKVSADSWSLKALSFLSHRDESQPEASTSLSAALVACQSGLWPAPNWVAPFSHLCSVTKKQSSQSSPRNSCLSLGRWGSEGAFTVRARATLSLRLLICTNLDNNTYLLVFWGFDELTSGKSLAILRWHMPNTS